MKTFAFLLLALAIPTASAATTTVSWGFVVTGASVEIDVGDTVQWVWDQDTQNHDVVSGSIASRPNGYNPSLFKSALQGKDSTFSHTFTEAGVFPYFCTPHPSMNAKITVGKDIVELAQDEAYLTTLVTALGLNGATLVGTLSGDGPFTVFAPTNDAFSNLDSTFLADLLLPANKDALTNVLTYHVASGKVLSSSLSNGQKIATVQGSEVEVTISGAVVKINDATVTTPDLSASNGVVHIIDAVLIPPVKSIVGLAQEQAYLTTLVTALTKATLVDTLSGPGPFTVFAPTDTAFGNLNSTLLSDLLEPANKDDLINVLTYHVASGKVLSSSLSNGQKIMTVQGSEVEVTIAGAVVKINTATVTTPDLPASNGVVHIIDAVLIPPAAVSGSSAAAEPESSTAAAEPESSTADAEPELSTGAGVDIGAAYNVSPTTKIAMITLLAAAIQFFGPQ